jgi:gamma-glutamyl:cysteine ligase YbdK (ATP-grasp superfamily)
MKQYRLFEGYGIELEYMLVDRDTLAVRPISDELLKSVLGSYGSDYENGIVTWSNELVMHVIELKSTRPESDFNALEDAFVTNIAKINGLLKEHNAMLMPSAAHPFMDPITETKLWPHDNNEVYDIYNRIFDCRGHGWSNLQSTHLNLPFTGEEEFAKLHAAIRVVLPLLPAICASSPVLANKATGYLDTRLIYYRDNQAKIPSITGKVIPEALFTMQAYRETVYERIAADINLYDPGEVLDPIWVNSRGAIPRFDRGSIEIRIMDIQECPAADLAVQTLVIETLKLLVEEKLMLRKDQERMGTDALAALLNDTMKSGGKVTIENDRYLSAWGAANGTTVTQLWHKIVQRILNEGNTNLKQRETLVRYILDHGTLAERMLRAFGNDISSDSMKNVFRTLSVCLATNKMFKS